MMTRRHALKTTALVAATAATLPHAIAQPEPVAPKPLITTTPLGPFTLPPLPYAVDALEPHLDARTMEIHHDKHHKAYVDNLNKAVAEFPTVGNKSIEELLADLNSIPEKYRPAFRNHGGGHHNHSLFWQMMKKDGGGEPKAELARAIVASFSSFAGFKAKFSEAALKVFGSGWAWLVLEDKELKIQSLPNQDSPLTPSLLPTEVNDSMGRKLTLPHHRQEPLLGLDVWEHAYYLKYQNKRSDYIAAWWNVVNWDFVAGRYAKLKG
jgi:superoxide dismutase, Fe-Mn family